MNKCIQCGKTEREQAKGCDVITCEHQFRGMTFKERQEFLSRPVNFKNITEDAKINYIEPEPEKEKYEFEKYLDFVQGFYLVTIIVFGAIFILSLIFFIKSFI